jgi:DNA-binding transcriptional MerR regulator
MSNTVPNAAPNAMKDRVANDFQTMKNEGGQRAAKIKEILRPAVAETVAEVKAGSTTIWSIAKSLTLAVVALFRDTVLPEQSAKLNEKVATVDERLTEKYGDRYQSIKQRLAQLKTQFDARTKKVDG